MPDTYELTRRGPEGVTIIERIYATGVVHADHHIMFHDESGMLLSVHQDHCISVRNITELGEEPSLVADVPGTLVVEPGLVPTSGPVADRIREGLADPQTVEVDRARTD